MLCFINEQNGSNIIKYCISNDIVDILRDAEYSDELKMPAAFSPRCLNDVVYSQLSGKSVCINIHEKSLHRCIMVIQLEE